MIDIVTATSRKIPDDSDVRIHPFSVDPVHCDFFWVIVCLGRK
jgi:hypothetical protein